MDEAAFKQRTKALGLAVISLVSELPKDYISAAIGRQLLRSATSVGANYRSACRGRSAADVVSKLGIVEEEADETAYWLEMLAESGLVRIDRVQSLIQESNEIVAMTVASRKTLSSRLAGRRTIG